MDQDLREKLQRDRDAAEIHIQEILSGDVDNYIVIKQTYLHPTYIGEECPLEDSRAALHYFRRTRDALETALITGSIPKSMRPLGKVPEYVRNLIEGYNIVHR